MSLDIRKVSCCIFVMDNFNEGRRPSKSAPLNLRPRLLPNRGRVSISSPGPPPSQCFNTRTACGRSDCLHVLGFNRVLLHQIGIKVTRDNFREAVDMHSLKYVYLTIASKGRLGEAASWSQ